jgi:uracil-DNA glycosylase family 4
MNYQRALRQYIEDYQRAGLDRIAVEMPEGVTSEKQPVTKPAVSARPITQKPVAAAPKSRAAPARVPPPRPVQAVRPSLPAGPKSDKSLTDRVSALQVLAGACAACTKCRELVESRQQTVFGVGNPQASIMFVGEAPGADEDRLGEPFVGKAGQLLDKIIQACKLKREDIYICNVLRCRPPGNRNPTPDEAANCREFLDGQIAIVDPDYIVCWGGVAAQNLLGVVTSVGKLRGKIHQHGRAKVICTYHPSYLLRNPSAKTQVWDDMKFLFAEMGLTL